MKENDKPLLSIVSPIHNEEENLERLHDEFDPGVDSPDGLRSEAVQLDLGPEAAAVSRHVPVVDIEPQSAIPNCLIG